MFKNRAQSIIFHVLATVLLSCGFVKTSEVLEQHNNATEFVVLDDGANDLIGFVPCSNNKR